MTHARHATSSLGIAVITTVVMVAALMMTMSVPGTSASVFDGSFCYECEGIMAEVQRDLGNATDIELIIKMIDAKLCTRFPIVERKIVRAIDRDPS